MTRFRLLALSLAVASTVAAPAHAVWIGNDQGGAEFPQGAVSFADTVASYDPVISGVNPTEPHRGAATALGLPDYRFSDPSPCPSQDECTSVSLGDGGSITLQFVDNRLTGSGTADPDLWIFEVGPDVEDMFVEISVDGVLWHAVGKVGGSTAGVDIDAYGWGTGSQFAFVRLRDDPLLDGQTGYSVGADIDAIGAISTVAVPEPSTLLMMGAGASLLAWRRRRARRA